MSSIESSSDPYNTLHLLNEKYKQYSPETRPKLIEAHTDRGSSVTKALKSLLGAKCQVCHACGFEKNNGEMYIEAHHITEVAACEINSLCSENIILVCPNCHREIHYGKNVKIVDRGESLYIETTKYRSLIHKNTLEYLIKLSD